MNELEKLQILLQLTGKEKAASTVGSIENLSSLIEPIMIVFMGIMIGGLMIAMYSPIFNVGALVG